MPRANRDFLPDPVWRIIHRFHKKELLLEFARASNRWMLWLYQAKKRFGLKEPSVESSIYLGPKIGHLSHGNGGYSG